MTDITIFLGSGLIIAGTIIAIFSSREDIDCLCGYKGKGWGERKKGTLKCPKCKLFVDYKLTDLLIDKDGNMTGNIALQLDDEPLIGTKFK